MTTQKFLKNIEDTFSKCLATAKAKNSDYAGVGDPFRNFNSSELVGVPIPRAILVRMMDKISRVSNLLDKEASVKDEPIADTLEDLINYTAILKAYLDEQTKITQRDATTLAGGIIRTDRGFVKLGGVDAD
jgi:ribosomal protein S18